MTSKWSFSTVRNSLLSAIRKSSPPSQIIKTGEWEIPIVIDPSLGPNTVQFRHPDGRLDRFYADPYLDIIGAKDIQMKINRIEHERMEELRRQDPNKAL